MNGTVTPHRCGFRHHSFLRVVGIRIAEAYGLSIVNLTFNLSGTGINDVALLCLLRSIHTPTSLPLLRRFTMYLDQASTSIPRFLFPSPPPQKGSAAFSIPICGSPCSRKTNW